MKNIKKILVPCDLSRTSLSGVKFAAEFAISFNAEIIILHVINKIPYQTIPSLTGDMEKMFKAESENAETRINNFIGSNIKNNIPISIEILWGDPGEEIIKLAQKENIDLVFLPVYDTTESADPITGTLSERVISESSIPVMFYKPGKTITRFQNTSTIRDNLQFGSAG